VSTIATKTPTRLLELRVLILSPSSSDRVQRPLLIMIGLEQETRLRKVLHTSGRLGVKLAKLLITLQRVILLLDSWNRLRVKTTRSIDSWVFTLRTERNGVPLILHLCLLVEQLLLSMILLDHKLLSLSLVRLSYRPSLVLRTI